MQKGKSEIITGTFLNLHTVNEVVYSWHWFLLSCTCCLFVAWLFLRYATPQYQITASLLIRDDSRGADFGDAALLEDLGFSTMKSSVDNEIEILRSRSLMAEVVSDLQLYIQYYGSGDFKTTELYDKSPFRLRFLHTPHIAKPATYNLTVLGENRYQLSNQIKSLQGYFGKPIDLPQGRAVLIKTSFNPAADNQYLISINVPKEIIQKHMDALSVAALNKLASAVSLSVVDELPVKGEAILNQLVANYLKASIRDKNRIADSTLRFINKNLADVSTELETAEIDIEQFRQLNKLTDVQESRRLLLETSALYARQVKDLHTRLKITESIENQLYESEHIAASSLFPNDAVTNELAIKYNELQLARKKTRLYTNDKHPVIQQIDSQIDQLKAELIEKAHTQRKEIQTAITATRAHEIDLEKEINRSPAHERTLHAYNRQREIKQDLYTYLLKKRVETAISRSSTTSNARIIDPPTAASKPKTPNGQLTFLLSVFIGLGIPFLFLQLRIALNDKVLDKSEVLDNCNIAILGEISEHKNAPKNYFPLEENSVVTEQFRTLRTNLHFLANSNKFKTLLITSSMGNEGKSFIAVNLSRSLAVAGKKVILVELDLRKPSIAYRLKLSRLGITNYLGSQKDIKEYVQQIGFPNPFDIISAGDIPLNPAELLTSVEITDLIQSLREKYDHIIFDTPPVGLVSDARLLSIYADLSIYVIRERFTLRSQLLDLSKILIENQFPNMQLVINGTHRKAGYNYNYAYKQKPDNRLVSYINKLKPFKST